MMMTKKDVDDLCALFEPEALDRRMNEIAELRGKLDPMSFEYQTLREDPLNIAQALRHTLEERMAKRSSRLAVSDGYFLSADRTTLVVLARTVLPSTRLDFNQALMHAVQDAENRALAAFRASGPGLTTALKGPVFGALDKGQEPGQLAVGFTGLPAVAIENQISLKYDLINNTVSSFIGVLLIFLLMFRSFSLAWNVTWTTFCVLTWTLALAWLTRGGISVFGGAFSCILLGIGTDYVTYLYNAFHEFRHVQRLDMEDAIRRTQARSGMSVITAMLTTVIAFYGVCFTRFTGMAEFGFLAGTTLLFYAAVTLLVFPAILGKPVPPDAMPTPRSLGMATWGRILEWRGAKSLTLVLSALLLGTSIVLVAITDPGPEHLAGVRFDSELGNMRSTRVHAIELRDKLSAKFGLGLADIRAVVEAPTDDLAYTGAEELLRRLHPREDSGELREGGSVLDFVPAPKQHEETIAALHAFDAAAALNRFRAAVEKRFGAKAVNAFSGFYERFENLSKVTSNATPVTLSELLASPLSTLLGSYVRIDEGPAETQAPSAHRVRLALSWYPKDNGQASGWYESLAADMERDPPAGVKILVTSARMVGAELKRSLFQDFQWITVVVAGSVGLCLLAAFGSVQRSLLALIPMIFGYSAMLGGVALCQRLGYEFSLDFVNLIMFPLLLGSGVDGGIYMVFDALAPARPKPSILMADTGRAVLCCILTTLVGFGSMLTSNYTGLISMGVAALYGYSGALFGSVIVLPALLTLRRKDPS
ncbi:MAG: MMPL family transporter [Planctomycetes bacterium]|nr:MMPL family transporter [Planctomycetota bacterium]